MKFALVVTLLVALTSAQKYWSGQCTAHPCEWYQNCGKNARRTGHRNCGFWDWGCEIQCEKELACGFYKAEGCRCLSTNCNLGDCKDGRSWLRSTTGACHKMKEQELACGFYKSDGCKCIGTKCNLGSCKDGRNWIRSTSGRCFKGKNGGKCPIGFKDLKDTDYSHGNIGTCGKYTKVQDAGEACLKNPLCFGFSILDEKHDIPNHPVGEPWCLKTMILKSSTSPRFEIPNTKKSLKNHHFCMKVFPETKSAGAEDETAEATTEELAGVDLEALPMHTESEDAQIEQLEVAADNAGTEESP